MGATPSPTWGNFGFNPQTIAALSAIPASAFPTVGSQSGNTASNLNTSQNLTGSTSGTTSQGFGNVGNDVIAQLLPLISKLAGNTNLAPYQANQIEGINQQARNNTEAVNSDLAARGLSRSPAATTAIGNINAQRSGAITNLNQQIPLLQNQLTSSNAGTINNILNSLPRTTSQTGTSSQGGSSSQTGNTSQNINTQQGGGIAGLFGGIGAALANLIK
jgi:hypothetical protein